MGTSVWSLRGVVPMGHLCLVLTRGGTLLRGPMLLAAGGAITFFVRATLGTLLTVRSVFVLVLGEASLNVALSHFFLAWGEHFDLPLDLLGMVESRFQGKAVPEVLLLVLSTLSEDLDMPSGGWEDLCVFSFSVGSRFSAL